MKALIAVITFLWPIQAVFAQQETMECVASYRNDEPHHQKEGAIIGSILNAAKISWVGVGTAGMSVDVSRKDADKARYLLAKAFIKQKLEASLTIKSATENRYIVVSPQDVIKRYESLNTNQGAGANP